MNLGFKPFAMDPKDARYQAYLAQKAIMSQFQNQNKTAGAVNPPKAANAPSPTPVSAPTKPVEKTEGKNHLMSRDSLKMLIRKYGNEKCDPEVEEFLQEIVSDFLTETITASCKLAMHRKGDLLELKDVQMYLGVDKKYNISIPGYGVTQKDANVSRTKAVAKSSAAQSHASRLQEVKDARLKGKGRR